jgi:acetylglutamate kinase
VKGAAGQAIQNLNLMLGLRRGSRAVFETGAVMEHHDDKRLAGHSWKSRTRLLPGFLRRVLTKFAVVHGGGVQITRMLEKMNVKSEFIDGLRVTDSAALGCVAAALLGEVHTGLVVALQRAGVPAVGVFGAVWAEKKSGPWGLVGTNVRADSAVLNDLLENGHVPVIPTLAIGESSL